MQRALFASLLALAASGCSYTPTPTDFIHTVDSAADLRACTRLGDVSPVVPTTPGFQAVLEGMMESTVALGGTHLYLDKRSNDWLLVRGIAYRCGHPSARQKVVVVRAKG